MEFAYYENHVVLSLSEFIMDGREARDEEKLNGFNKEEKTPGNFIKNSPKNLGPLNLSVILGSPGNRKLCEVSEGLHEAK